MASCAGSSSGSSNGGGLPRAAHPSPSSPEDEKALAAFAAPRAGKERVLADIILEKIHLKESGRGDGVRGENSDADEMLIPDGIDSRVVDVYRQVGDLLRRYTVGKIPKAFKIIPALANWEEVLYLTNPRGFRKIVL